MDVCVPDAKIAEIKLVPVAEAILHADWPHSVLEMVAIRNPRALADAVQTLQDAITTDCVEPPMEPSVSADGAGEPAVVGVDSGETSKGRNRKLEKANNV